MTGLVVAACILLFLQLTSLLAALVLLPRWFARQKAEIADALRVFVVSPNETDPSPLAVIADQFASLMATRFWQHVEKKIGGVGGVMVREAGKAEIAELATANPLAALLASFLPKKFRNLLVSHPEMLGQLRLAGSGDGQKTSVRERLAKGG